MSYVSHPNIFVVGERGLLGNALMDAGCNAALHWDITDGEQAGDIIRRAYARFGADLVIINCAGKTNVDGCETDPLGSMAVNLAGPAILANRLGVLTGGKARLIQISTDFIFNGVGGPYSTMARPNPLSVYGAQKYLAEGVVQTYPNHTIVRTTALYGKHPKKFTFVHWVVNELRSEQRAPVVYAGQWTTPTDVVWLARALIDLCAQPTTRLVHLAGREFVSRYDWACDIAEAFGYSRGMITRSVEKPVQKAVRPEVGGLVLTAGYNPPKLLDSLKELARTC